MRPPLTPARRRANCSREGFGLNTHKQRRIALIAGVLLGAILIALSLWQARGSTQAVLEGTAADPRGLGPANAAVKAVVYFDFQCSHCEALHRVEEQAIVDQFVRGGQLHLEARPVGIMGPASQLAAEANACAADQTKFWAYRHTLFLKYREFGPSAYSNSSLITTARDLGLDVASFQECLSSRRHQETINGFAAQAKADGFTGVPAMMIADQKLPGRQPMDYYLGAIRQALGK